MSGALRLWRGPLVVGGALFLVLALTLALAFVPLGPMNAVFSYGLAAVKALLVALVFMKLRSSPALLSLAAVAGLVWLLTLFALTATDYGARQKGETIETQPSARAEDAAAGAP